MGEAVKRPVVVYQTYHGMSAAMKAEQVADLQKKYGMELTKPTTDDALAALSGLMGWLKEWPEVADDERASLLLVYHNGVTGDQSFTGTARCSPLAFAVLLAMAAPEGWFSKT